MRHGQSRTPVPTILDYPNILMRTLVMPSLFYVIFAEELPPRAFYSLISDRYASGVCFSTYALTMANSSSLAGTSKSRKVFSATDSPVSTLNQSRPKAYLPMPQSRGRCRGGFFQCQAWLKPASFRRKELRRLNPLLLKRRKRCRERR